MSVKLGLFSPLTSRRVVCFVSKYNNLRDRKVDWGLVDVVYEGL